MKITSNWCQWASRSFLTLSNLAEVQYKASGFWGGNASAPSAGRPGAEDRLAPGADWRSQAAAVHQRWSHCWLSWRLWASCFDTHPVTGSNGQLGRALRASLPATLAGEPVELIATARKPEPARGVVGLDLSDPDACNAAVVAHQPDWVLNAGAYTAVDRAEAEPELAHAVNANAPRAFAESLARISNGSRLLQISTDFVFSGKQSHPYRPGDPAIP